MLVIFFIFHILLLTIPFFKVAGAPRRIRPDQENFSQENVKIFRFRDGLSQNASAFRTQKPMFEILRNLTKSGASNLKSHIFDKMLSEEMLSMKQRLFENDLVQASTTKKIKHNSAPTPTIEVQQKWSVVDLFTNPTFDEEITKSDEDTIVSNENSIELDLLHNDLKNKSAVNKILGLRSLPSVRHVGNLNVPNQAQGYSYGNNNLHATTKCGCTRADHHRCTQTVFGGYGASTVSYYPVYLQPYQTFFFSDNNVENPYDTYYHPKVVDDTKVPKKMKYRKTTPLPLDVYYDSREVVDDDCPTQHETKPPKILMNIDYDIVDDKPKITDCQRDGNNFDVMNDLNEVFNDGVNKRCYCSDSALTFPKQRNALFIFMIVHVFQLHYKILFV